MVVVHNHSHATAMDVVDNHMEPAKPCDVPIAQQPTKRVADAELWVISRRYVEAPKQTACMTTTSPKTVKTTNRLLQEHRYFYDNKRTRESMTSVKYDAGYGKTTSGSRKHVASTRGRRSRLPDPYIRNHDPPWRISPIFAGSAVNSSR